MQLYSRWNNKNYTLWHRFINFVIENYDVESDEKYIYLKINKDNIDVKKLKDLVEIIKPKWTKIMKVLLMEYSKENVIIIIFKQL